MLPTKKFNDLPVVSGVVDSTRIFCIVDGVDSLVTIATLKTVLGTSATLQSDIPVASTYGELLGLAYGGEYYDAPYIYKRIATGAVRINPDTEFDIPTGSSVSTGFVVATYAQLLLSASSFEYHEMPYVYKKYPYGIFRINVDTEFSVPTGSGVTNGIVVSTYSGLLDAQLGYEYHEMPFIYKRITTGAVRINIDTEFTAP